MNFKLPSQASQTKGSPPKGTGYLFVQPKLKINAPGDALEQEADAMADRVMQNDGHSATNNTIASASNAISSAGTAIQRKCAQCQSSPSGTCANCAEEEEKNAHGSVMRKEAGPGSFFASSGLAAGIARSQGHGRGMAGPTRNFMERSFGADFSGVRIHTGAESHQMNQMIGARAFTHGNNIYFGNGNYQPQSSEGMHLLAHELTHTIQQKGGDHVIQRDTDPPKEQPKEFVIVKTMLIPQPDNKGIVFLFRDDGKYVRLQVSYQGNPNPGTYRYNSDHISAEENERMGGTGIVIKAKSWIITYKLPDSYGKPVHAPRNELVVIDKRLLSDTGNVKLQPAELEQLSGLTESFSDYDFNELRKYPKGGRALNFQQARQMLLDYRRKKRKQFGTELDEAVASAKLYGLEDVYMLYWGYQWRRNPLGFKDHPMVQKFLNDYDKYGGIDDIESRLKAALIIRGFRKDDPIKDFEAYISRYVRDFIQTGLQIALQALDRAQTTAENEYARYIKSGGTEVIYSKLAEARKAHKEAKRDQFSADIVTQYGDADDAKAYKQLADKQEATSAEQYQKVGNDYPILQQYNRKDLLDESESFFEPQNFRADIYDKIAAIKRAREKLLAQPDYIFKLDSLMELIYSIKGIKPDSILDMIIENKKYQIEQDESFTDSIIMLITLVLIPFTGGASLFALGAQMALTGLSIYSAVHAVDRYAMAKTFYDAHLSSDAPSVFWVAVAVAGAGLDTGMLMSAFSKTAQIAGKYPIFKNNVEQFAKELEGTQLLEHPEALGAGAKAAESTLKEAIITQAKVQSELDTAFQAAKPELTAAGASMASKESREALSQLAATSATKGYYHFEEYLLILKRNNIITDFEHLAPAEQAAVKEAFGHGVGDAEQSFEHVLEQADQYAAEVEKAKVPLDPDAPGYAVTDEMRAASKASEDAMAAQRLTDAIDIIRKDDPALADIIANNKVLMADGKTTLRELAADSPSGMKRLYAEWSEGRKAGNIKSADFGDYVKVRMRGFRGRGGELTDAFLREQKRGEILVKAPKPQENLPGTDALSYETASKRVKLLDNKAVRTGSTVRGVSALERNLAENIGEDIKDLEQFVIHQEGVPSEIEDIVLPRLKNAKKELEDYIQKNGLNAENLKTEAVQKEFNRILDKNGIDRVVTVEGAGKDVSISGRLEREGFKLEPNYEPPPPTDTTPPVNPTPDPTTDLDTK